MLAGELRLVYLVWLSAIDGLFWCYFVSLVVCDDCEPYMRKLVDTSDCDLRHGTRFSGRHISAADFLPLSQHGVAGVIVCVCVCVFFFYVSLFFHHCMTMSQRLTHAQHLQLLGLRGAAACNHMPAGCFGSKPGQEQFDWVLARFLGCRVFIPCLAPENVRSLSHSIPRIDDLQLAWFCARYRLRVLLPQCTARPWGRIFATT